MMLINVINNYKENLIFIINQQKAQWLEIKIKENRATERTFCFFCRYLTRGLMA